MFRLQSYCGYGHILIMIYTANFDNAIAIINYLPYFTARRHIISSLQSITLIILDKFGKQQISANVNYCGSRFNERELGENSYLKMMT